MARPDSRLALGEACESRGKVPYCTKRTHAAMLNTTPDFMKEDCHSLAKSIQGRKDYLTQYSADIVSAGDGPHADRYRALRANPVFVSPPPAPKAKA